MSEAGLPAHYTDFAASAEAGVSVYTTHHDLDGSGLQQQLITIEPTSRIERQVPDGREEVLYVMAGRGQLHGDSGACELGPDIAVLMGGSQCYELEVASTGAPLEVVAVSGRALSKTTVDPSRARIDLAQQVADGSALPPLLRDALRRVRSRRRADRGTSAARGPRLVLLPPPRDPAPRREHQHRVPAAAGGVHPAR